LNRFSLHVEVDLCPRKASILVGIHGWDDPVDILIRNVGEAGVHHNGFELDVAQESIPVGVVALENIVSLLSFSELLELHGRSSLEVISGINDLFLWDLAIPVGVNELESEAQIFLVNLLTESLGESSDLELWELSVSVEVSKLEDLIKASLILSWDERVAASGLLELINEGNNLLLWEQAVTVCVEVRPELVKLRRNRLSYELSESLNLIFREFAVSVGVCNGVELVKVSLILCRKQSKKAIIFIHVLFEKLGPIFINNFTVYDYSGI
jgi:hypothetical protein